jgi:hypothetical protein
MRQGEMKSIMKLWLRITMLFGAVLVVWEGLAGSEVSVALGRAGLVLFAFGALRLMVLRWRDEARGAVTSAGRPQADGNDGDSKPAVLIYRQKLEPKVSGGTSRGPGQRLSGQLKLAADHADSIRTLLEVCQAHERPIPRAALQNLGLVSKQLREMEKQLSAD